MFELGNPSFRTHSQRWRRHVLPAASKPTNRSRELRLAPDDHGDETHIDRTLNVIGSGFQHQRYFADIEEIILSIFDNDDFERQPRYIADMGCGDGSLLKRIHEVVIRTRRGAVLERHPL